MTLAFSAAPAPGFDCAITPPQGRRGARNAPSGERLQTVWEDPDTRDRAGVQGEPGGDVELRNNGHQAFLYPVHLALRYKALSSRQGVVATGSGQTTHIGSHQIIFTGDLSVPKGTRVEVSVAWPALLEERVKLQLVVQARVTSVDAGRITVEVRQYQFRTRATARAREEWAFSAVSERESLSGRAVPLAAHA